MNENNLIKYGLLTVFFKVLSITIALIMLEAPVLVVILVPIVMFLPFLIAIPEFMSVLLHIYNILRPILYTIAIITTIKGKQDLFAIAFYIVTALQVFSMIRNLVFTITSILTLSNHNK